MDGCTSASEIGVSFVDSERSLDTGFEVPLVEQVVRGGFAGVRQVRSYVVIEFIDILLVDGLVDEVVGL